MFSVESAGGLRRVGRLGCLSHPNSTVAPVYVWPLFRSARLVRSMKMCRSSPTFFNPARCEHGTLLCSLCETVFHARHVHGTAGLSQTLTAVSPVCVLPSFRARTVVSAQSRTLRLGVSVSFEPRGGARCVVFSFGAGLRLDSNHGTYLEPS